MLRVAPTASCTALLVAACTAACPGARGDGPDARISEAPMFHPPPGAAPRPPPLDARLRRAFAALGPGHTPRTHHHLPDGRPRYVNRLILDASPYLLQHAHNPVDWYPWGDEAFAEARRRGVPVLLSVGYSTCHWCHVMERESFEDEEIAAWLNAHYVAIKVDREVRPDVDAVYMRAVTLLSGRGGWPMTVLMTPEREPFFGGTYFPARDGDRGARKGFLTVLKELSARYTADRASVVREARELTQRIARDAVAAHPAGVPGPEALAGLATDLARTFDPVWGGFGGAPKFPPASSLDFLLRYHRRTGDAAALVMVTRTLHRMAAGGLRDHVGGGFHRYATDGRWLVPHFEKMLYDNAQLAVTYTDASRVTGDAELAHVARETLDYVLREMTTPEGAFHSATDADSEGEEGRFFVWKPAEIDAILGVGLAAKFKKYYGLDLGANFEGNNILYTPQSLQETAASLGMEPTTLDAELGAMRRLLHVARARRVPPLTDDKVLAAWNGLMVSAVARAGRVFGEARYVAAARAAARFVLDRMRSDGRLRRSFRGAVSAEEGFLEDHAFMTSACLDLLEATGETRWLDEALALQAAIDARFASPSGAYHAAGDGHETLIARDIPSFDGAVPSGNSVAAENLLRLHYFTTNEQHRTRAHAVLSALAGPLRRGGRSVPRLAQALDMDLGVVREVLVVGPGAHDSALARVLAGHFGPDVVSVVMEVVTPADVARIPWLDGKGPRGGRVTAYVCEKGSCELPATDPEVFRKQLARASPLPGGAPPPLVLAEPVAPWHHDVARNRHWHPDHGHWHDGPPPPAGRRP